VCPANHAFHHHHSTIATSGQVCGNEGERAPPNQNTCLSSWVLTRLSSTKMAAANTTSGGNSAYHNFNNDFAHIQDPNERRRLALAEVDKAPFGWYHVRAIVVAGVGFFTDSYDIFAVSLLTTMLGIVYFPGKGSMPTSSDTAIKLATSSGTVIGQLGFGFLADVVGRKRMYGLELIVIIFATLAQALTSGSPSMNIIGVIIFWRVLMVSGSRQGGTQPRPMG
jgi:MFS transporter, PHS family, inorganic phosphate transporter